MNIQDCKSKVGCNASICPLLEQDEREHLCWFSDEDICKIIHTLTFSKQQKKIKKKCRYPDTYFTYDMLNRNFTVGKAIRGLDPDRKRSPQLKIWLKNHKERRKLTQAEKDRITERFKKAKI